MASLRVIKPVLIALLLFSNFLMLFIFVFFASRYGNNAKLFSQRLHEMAKRNKLEICYTTAGANPFILPKGGIEHEVFPEYLREANIQNTKIETYCQCDTVLTPNPSPRERGERTKKFICTTAYELEHDSCLVPFKDKCEIEMSSFPTGLSEFLDSAKREELDKNTFVILRVNNNNIDLAGGKYR